MDSIKKHTEHLDNETMRSMVFAAAAAGCSWAAGASPAEAAAIAAISNVGGALARSAGVGGRDKAKTALVSDLCSLVLVVPTGLLAAKTLGFSSEFNTLGSASAGIALGALALWYVKPFGDPTYDHYRDLLPALAYPLIGWMVGKLRPQWITPMQGLVLAGLLAASRLTKQYARDKAEYSAYPVITTLSMAALMATPLMAGKLGVPVNYSQFAVAAVATTAIPSVIRLAENYWPVRDRG